MNSTNQLSSIVIPFSACIFYDFPESREDCSAETCLKSLLFSRFLNGGELNDFGASGHNICIVIWLLTVILGLGGVLGNLFIVHVIKLQKRTSSFDILLIALAWTDLFCSFFCVATSTAIVIYYENLSRGMWTLYMFYLSAFTGIFLKSTSSFLTVAITVERYLIIGFPHKFRGFFSVRKTQMTAALVVLFSFILAMPRYLSVQVVKNEDFRDLETTRDLEYLMIGTPQTNLFYGKMGSIFNQIDFWSPLPILLLFNSLIYFHVRKFAAQRKEQNIAQTKELRAVRMFYPVVAVLFLTNVVPIILFTFTLKYKVVYREIYSATFLSFAFNSASNLPIYYAKGSGFRNESKEALVRMFPSLNTCFSTSPKNVSEMEASMTGTKTSTAA